MREGKKGLSAQGRGLSQPTHIPLWLCQDLILGHAWEQLLAMAPRSLRHLLPGPWAQGCSGASWSGHAAVAAMTSPEVPRCPQLCLCDIQTCLFLQLIVCLCLCLTGIQTCVSLPRSPQGLGPADSQTPTPRWQDQAPAQGRCSHFFLLKNTDGGTPPYVTA